MTIYFYGGRGPHGCFCNVSRHGFALGGLWWRTVEHRYHAEKFAGTPYADAIRRAATPWATKRMGRSRLWAIRSDWDAVKEAVMFEAVLRKFETHADIRSALLATGDATLVEASPTDWYWGCGRDGTGRNRMGEILMKVRGQLQHRLETLDPHEQRSVKT